MAADRVRVRIAPSPTGDPHVGTAYVALFNYAFAKHHGGDFVLRIEDTDRARSSRASEEAILRSLRWLGLRWDEGPDVGGRCGPYRQSERAAIYREHAELLVARGHAYRCFCTAERLERLRERQRAAKTPPGYDGQCRELSTDELAAQLASGAPHTLRLKMPRTGEAVFDDLLRGTIRMPFAHSDDQVLLKSDGLPTYHLANVVDDHLMEISHVIRAEEWIPSVPKHLRLYEAFGWQPPRMVHLPLLRNNDKNKSKISKRRNPVSLDYYREAGIVPQAMLNFLALMGWSFGGDQEKFTLEQMIERFDLTPGSIGLAGPVFDLEKLSWLNGLYLRDLSDAELVDQLIGWRLNRDYLLRLAPLVRERIRRFDEFIPLTEFFFSGDLELGSLGPQLVPKKRNARDTAVVVDALADELDGVREWEPSALEAVLRGCCERVQWSSRELFMVVRLAVSGRSASPPLFDTMVAVGRELCRRRLRQAAAWLRAQPSAEPAPPPGPASA